MAEGTQKTSGPHLEITYQAPFAGVASDKSPIDIDPPQFVVADGVVDIDGLLCYNNVVSKVPNLSLKVNAPADSIPYDPGSTSAYVTIAVVSLAQINPSGSGPGLYYNALLFTVADTSDLSVGLIFQLSGYPVGSPLNSSFQIAKIISSTEFTTIQPMLPTSTSSATGQITYLSLTGGGGTTASSTPPSADVFAESNEGGGSVVTETLTFPPGTATAVTVDFGSNITLPSGGDSAITQLFYSTDGGITWNLVVQQMVTTAPAPFIITAGEPYDLALFQLQVVCTTSSVPNESDLTIAEGILNSAIATLAAAPPLPSRSWEDAYLCLIFNCAGYLCAVDQYGASYIAAYSGTDIQFFPDQIATDGLTPNHGIPTCVKVINGVAYVSIYSTNTLYAYVPTVSYAPASTYTAGKFIAVLTEYLIQLNTNSAADGVQPSRVNWSGPDEFTTWDPSVDRTAGFDTLTVSEDEITGFVSLANVGFIFLKYGVVQMTPTGIAIQPWDFTVLWSSVIGQGTIFPATLTQFGNFVFLVTDSDIYIFNSGSFQSIAKQARKAIYKTFNLEPASNAEPNSSIVGSFSLYSLNNSTPNPMFVFAVSNPGVNTNIVFWFYNIDRGGWYSVTRSLNDLISEYLGSTVSNAICNFIRSNTVFLDAVASGVVVNNPNLSVSIIYVNASYLLAGLNYTATFIFYNVSNDDISTDIDPEFTLPYPIDITFKQEEIKIWRQPTVRRVVVVAAGTGTLLITVGNISFSSIVLDGTNNYKTYTSSGMFTGERPQLNVSSAAFLGYIVKAMMVATYADGDID